MTQTSMRQTPATPAAAALAPAIQPAHAVSGRVLTGRHVLAITVSAFAVIIGVNLVMAWKAVATFPGLEVASSYTAGQGFNARRAAQEALGWQVATQYAAGELRLNLTTKDGSPVKAQRLEVLVGRTTEANEDVTPAFAWRGDHYASFVALHPGQWMMKVSALAENGTVFERRIDFWVKE